MPPGIWDNAIVEQSPAVIAMLVLAYLLSKLIDRFPFRKSRD